MSEWIDVKDRLPDEVDSYLVYRPDSDPPYVTSLWEEGEWWPERGDVALDGITHWMPLPDPPAPKLTAKEALRIAVTQLNVLEKAGFAKQDATYVIAGELARVAFSEVLPRLRAALESEE
jgi:hypothetical protein